MEYMKKQSGGTLASQIKLKRYLYRIACAECGALALKEKGKWVVKTASDPDCDCCEGELKFDGA